MSSKAELQGRLANLAQPQKAPRITGTTAAAKEPQAAKAPRAKPIRVSVDLAPQDYRYLAQFCNELAADIGRAKVPHVEVLRALVNELRDNPVLAAAIHKSVSDDLSK